MNCSVLRAVPGPLAAAFALTLAAFFALTLSACDSRQLPGRLIIASVADPEPRGVVDAFDPSTGERTRLWDTGPETSAWAVAPDGLHVSYLAAVREPSLIERLVVRSPEVGADERILASEEAAIVRFAGYAWAADGQQIAVMRQLGFPGSLPDDDARWEIRRAILNHDGTDVAAALLWSVEAADLGAVALTLAAWDAAAGRAAVLESGLDGGPAVALRWIDMTNGQMLERLSIDGAGEGFAAAPGGSRLAWFRIDNAALVVFRLADGTIENEIPNDSGARRDSLFWSADAQRLAWREDGPPGSAEETRVVVVDLTGGNERREHALPDRALRPLTYSPDGDWLLIGAGEPGGVETSELYVVQPMGADPPTALGWTAPAGRWGLAWVR